MHGTEQMLLRKQIKEFLKNGDNNAENQYKRGSRMDQRKKMGGQ